jgi:hypothetical protein
MMGKTAGRWTKEEHKKFVQGKILTYLYISLFQPLKFMERTGNVLRSLS